MHNILQTIETLEQACESESDLLAFTPPQLEQILATIKALPEDQREEVRGRLARISTIIEGQMMLYAEELEKLGGQIRNVANNNAATHAYRTVAILPVRQD